MSIQPAFFESHAGAANW